MKKTIRTLSDSDAELVSRLYSDYKDAVLAKVSKSIKNHHYADDCLSLIFFRVIANIDKFRERPEEDNIRLIYRITSSVIIDMYRSEVSRHDIPMSELDETDEEGNIISFGENEDSGYDLQNEAAKSELKNRLLSIIMKLDETDKNIVMMKYYDMMTTKEISEILNINHSTVRSRLQRALAKLREELENEQDQ